MTDPAKTGGCSTVLDAIQQKTGAMPLVLHGGTGISDDMILTDPAKTGGCSTAGRYRVYSGNEKGKEDGSFIPFYPIVGEGDELK